MKDVEAGININVRALNPKYDLSAGDINTEAQYIEVLNDTEQPIQAEKLIVGTDSNDKATNTAWNGFQVNLGKGTDSYTNNAEAVTINAGDDNDSIINSGADVSIFGGAGNDMISLGADAENATVNGGAGNDTIYGSGNNATYEYDSTSGNDIIYSFNPDTDKFVLDGVKVISSKMLADSFSVTLGTVDATDNTKTTQTGVIKLMLDKYPLAERQFRR